MALSFSFFIVLYLSLRFCHHGNTNNLYPADPTSRCDSYIGLPCSSLDPSLCVNGKGKSCVQGMIANCTKRKKKKKWRKRQITYGFTPTDLQPQCVALWKHQLFSMKHLTLLRHLEAKHLMLKEKSKDFSSKKIWSIRGKKYLNLITKTGNTNMKALQPSYLIILQIIQPYRRQCCWRSTLHNRQLQDAGSNSMQRVVQLCHLALANVSISDCFHTPT